jgi:uncharacterized protein
VVVAFSGGVDSSLLLGLAKDVLGKNVIAVTAASPLQPKNELAEAKKIARRLGVKHMIINAAPLKRKEVRNNQKNRCYHCKLQLLREIKSIAQKHNYVAIEATNRSDLHLHRPGIKAVRHLGIVSPLLLAGFEKKDIRKAAHRSGLSNWDKPAAACLASRIPYGQKLTVQRLKRIDKAEDYLRRCKFTQVRVRDHFPIARIEVDPSEFDKAIRQRKRIERYLNRLGYKYVTLDLEGYQTGSLDR